MAKFRDEFALTLAEAAALGHTTIARWCDAERGRQSIPRTVVAMLARELEIPREQVQQEHDALRKTVEGRLRAKVAATRQARKS